MKKIILFFCSLFLAQSLPAQLGLTNGFQNLHAPIWGKAIQTGYGLSDAKVFRSRVYASVDWSFQSKKIGLQLSPELGLSRQEVTVPYVLEESPINTGNLGTISNTYQGIFLSFMVNADFFLLRFNKPLKSMPLISDGNWFKEGLFLRFGVGATEMGQRKITDVPNQFSGGSGSGSKASGSFRLGLGLKLKILEFFSVSPMVATTYSSAIRWEGFGSPTTFEIEPTFGFPDVINDPNFTSPLSTYFQTMASIRLEINFRKMAILKRKSK